MLPRANALRLWVRAETLSKMFRQCMNKSALGLVEHCNTYQHKFSSCRGDSQCTYALNCGSATTPIATANHQHKFEPPHNTTLPNSYTACARTNRFARAFVYMFGPRPPDHLVAPSFAQRPDGNRKNRWNDHEQAHADAPAERTKLQTSRNAQLSLPTTNVGDARHTDTIQHAPNMPHMSPPMGLPSVANPRCACATFTGTV